MTRHFKKSYNITNHTIIISTIITPVQIITAHFTQINTYASHTKLMTKSMKLLDKHVHLKTQNQNLKKLRTPMTLTVLIATLTLHQTQKKLSLADGIIEVKLSNMKYAAIFPVTINKNNTISLTQKQLFPVCQMHALTNYNPIQH